MEKETEESKTPLSRHYFYRKATQPDQPFNTVFLKGLDSSSDFEDRVNQFVSKQSLRCSISQVQKEAAHDLSRRRAERKARKEREEIASGNLYGSLERSAESKSLENVPRKDKQLFQKSIILSAADKNAWLANIHDDAMLMNPHQWLKLANLFNVNSRAVRQQTFLDFSSSEDVLKDRSIERDDLKPLENYMELRDIQNRNYARDAVAEGIKFTKQNRIKEAMEFYKRSLEMDPKYPEGWFHLAESLVQQRKLVEAAEHLERVLKLDSSHEGAIALLASIHRTTQPKKPESEWDLVDEHGESMTKKLEEPKHREQSDEEEESRKKKKKRRSRSREKHRRSKSPSDRKRRQRDESVESTRRLRRHHRDESADYYKKSESRKRDDSRRKEVSRRRDDSRNSRHQNNSRDRHRHDERHKRDRRSRSPGERSKRDYRSRLPAEKRRRRSSSPRRRDYKRKRSLSPQKHSDHGSEKNRASFSETKRSSSQTIDKRRSSNSKEVPVADTTKGEEKKADQENKQISKNDKQNDTKPRGEQDAEHPKTLKRNFSGNDDKGNKESSSPSLRDSKKRELNEHSNSKNDLENHDQKTENHKDDRSDHRESRQSFVHESRRQLLQTNDEKKNSPAATSSEIKEDKQEAETQPPPKMNSHESTETNNLDNKKQPPLSKDTDKALEPDESKTDSKTSRDVFSFVNHSKRHSISSKNDDKEASIRSKDTNKRLPLDKREEIRRYIRGERHSTRGKFEDERHNTRGQFEEERRRETTPPASSQRSFVSRDDDKIKDIVKKLVLPRGHSRR